MKKPAFINPIQKVKAGVVRSAGVSLDNATADGCYPVDAFKPGFAEMAEEDWRVFELTPADAAEMVATANADLAAGKKLRGNYAHDRSGPIAAQVARVEFTAEGGVRQLVKWTERAQTAIRAGEYEGTSPEFLARVVLDDKGNPKEVNGRVLMQPFALMGFALDNDPAMPDLAIAANTESQQPDTGKEDLVIKKLALKLGLPETATAEDVEKAFDAKMKPAEKPKTEESAVTVEAVAAAVLAKIDPAGLAKEIRAAAVKEATEAFRAETHEKAVVQTVDAAIRGGRIKKSERDAALAQAAGKCPKCATVNPAALESFKTMTASMKVVAPVTPIYQAGASVANPNPEGVKDEDLGNDEAFVEAAEKRSAEKKIDILTAARQLRAEAAK